MKKDKIVILGGTKYVGLSLIKHIKNYKVYVLSKRLICQYDIESIIIDRKNKQDLRRVLNKIQPQIILDMICYEERDAIDIANIMESMTYLNHYIMISTFFIYNYSDKYEDFSDINLGLIDDNYTKNKYLAEKQIFNSSVFHKTSIVRFPFIFSHDDYTKRFQFMINNVLSNNEVKIDDLKCSFISKDDAYKSLIELLECNPQGFIDIANSGCVTLGEIYNIISDLCKKSIIFLNCKRDVYIIKRNICLKSKKALDFNINSVYQAVEIEAKKLLMDNT